MNIDRIEEITKEIRRKEKKIERIEEQKDIVNNELQDLHDELATLIIPNQTYNI